MNDPGHMERDTDAAKGLKDGRERGTDTDGGGVSEVSEGGQDG